MNYLIDFKIEIEDNLYKLSYYGIGFIYVLHRYEELFNSD